MTVKERKFNSKGVHRPKFEQSHSIQNMRNCPEFIDELEAWFQTLSEKALGELWVGALASFIAEIPEADAGSFTRAMSLVKQRLCK